MDRDGYRWIEMDQYGHHWTDMDTNGGRRGHGQEGGGNFVCKNS